MANKSLFQSLRGMLVPAADARNLEGAPAYALSPRHKLAQLAVTGTLQGTFYANAEMQLAEMLKVACEVDAEFIAKTAIYARNQGRMKDMPALLVAWLSMMATPHFTPAFTRVIDNGRMLRNFVQIMRSGVTGRKSLGTRPKKLVQAWLEEASDRRIMQAAVGQDPSLADIIRMVHPKPKDKGREALYGYLIGRPYDVALLPQAVRDFEAFKMDPSRPVPDVPFQMLTALPLETAHWVAIARQTGWQALRMNLNTFARHGVFAVPGMAEEIAARLANAEAIRQARALPYQLMVAYTSTDAAVPLVVRTALQEAMEIALANVPAVTGRIVICPDVSGSMRSPITGYRKGASSVVRCVDVAALVAAAMLRMNMAARILPFEQGVVKIDLNPRDTVLTNAEKLAAIGGGGTNCSAPIEQLIAEKAKVDLVLFISDNESWMDASRSAHQGTGLMRKWQELKAINPAAKLICLDLQPYGTTPAKEAAEILNIGGFSDTVFEMIAAFATSGSSGETWGPDYWVNEIEKIELGTV